MIPVVLHHGLFGYDELRFGNFRHGYFRGIDEEIARRGYRVILARAHPTGAIERRAQQLKEVILRSLPPDRGPTPHRVVIIAHSLGGLDARYMLDKLDMAQHVSALVTVTTPHYGSPFADWMVRNIGQRLGVFAVTKALGIDMEGLLDVTTERCRGFNDRIGDAPGVRYISISAARPWNLVPPFAIYAHNVVYQAEGDNDSIVSVKSSTRGEHWGVWPADHWHTINHRLVLEFKNPTGDIAPYYLRILERLAGEGLTGE